MTVRRHVTRNIRVRIHADGNATLAGTHYQDLRQMLTAAWLYCDEQLKKAERADNAQNVAYYKQRLKFLEVAENNMKDAVAATHPKHEPTIASRRAAVENSRQERLLIERILNDEELRPKRR